MALNAMAAGLTWADLRHMKYTHVMQLLYEWEDMNGVECDEVRDATADDVMALTRL